MLHDIWCFCPNYWSIVLYMLLWWDVYCTSSHCSSVCNMSFYFWMPSRFSRYLGIWMWCVCVECLSSWYFLDWLDLCFVVFYQFWKKSSFIVFSSIFSILAFSLLVDMLNWYCPIALKSSVPFLISFFFVFQFEYFLLTYFQVHWCFLHCVELNDEFVKGNPHLYY